MNSTRTLGMILVAACVATTSASGQAAGMLGVSATDSSVVAVTPAPAQAGPRIDATAVALRQTVRATTPVAFVAAQSAGMGKPVALILVGLGAIAVGDVMDDDIGTLFSIAGAVMLLVGLYQLVK